MTFTGPAPAAPTGRRAAWWWLAGGTFVVGLLVGVLVAGLLIRNAPEPGSSAGATPSTGEDPAVTSAATTTGVSGATVEILVNEACLRALNAAQDAYGAIERVGGAIVDLDFAELDAIVRQLQPLQAALRNDVSACQVSTRLPDGSLVTSSVQPTPVDGTTEPDVTVTAPTTR